MKYLILFSFTLFSYFSAMGQTKLSDLSHNLNEVDEVGETVECLNTDGSDLAPGKYEYQTTNGTNNLQLHLLVSKKGVINGVINTINAKNDTIMRCHVKQNKIYHLKKYGSENKLQTECVKINDTVITKEYDPLKEQLTHEYHEVGEKITLDKRYSYIDGIYCSLENKLEGIFEHYRNDILEDRTLTKGLAEGTEKETLKFDENETIYCKEIYYTDGKIKIENQDGTYTIKVGNLTNKHDKSGKLISSSQRVYID